MIQWEKIVINISLKRDSEIDEAVERLNKSIQEAAWQLTPEDQLQAKQFENQSAHIKELTVIKRRARRIWQNSKKPDDKRTFRIATGSLKKSLQELSNQYFHEHLQNLT